MGLQGKNGWEDFGARKGNSTSFRCRSQNTCHLVSTWQDIDVLQSVHSAVKDLADFTDMLSGEGLITLSSLRAILHILKNEVVVESLVDTTLTKDIKRCTRTYLEGKYSNVETSEMMNLSSFLDPRFITDYIANSDFGIVKDRFMREGSDTYKETTEESSGSTKPLESDKDGDDDDAVNVGLSVKLRKLSNWLKASR